MSLSSLTTCYIGKPNDERFLCFSLWNTRFARRSASLESIAGTHSSGFNVRFARAENQLAMFAPRQRHEIAAAAVLARSTQRIFTRIEFLRVPLSDLARLPPGFKLFDEAVNNVVTWNIFTRYTRSSMYLTGITYYTAVYVEK